MKIHLTEDKLWRGQTYLKGDREIPDELAIALGLDVKDEGERIKDEGPLPTPHSPLSDKSTTVEDLSSVFESINQAQLPQALEPLKGIGRGSAKLILKRRPTGGYESREQLQALNADLEKPPYKVNWSIVFGD